MLIGARQAAAALRKLLRRLKLPNFIGWLTVGEPVPAPYRAETSNLVLTRQKTILALLAEAKGALSHTALVKLMFLLRHESRLCEDKTFYDFVPYRFGPFSFALYRELAALRRDGYLSDSEDIVVQCRASRSLSAERVAELPHATKRAITQIFHDYGKLSPRKLIGMVYEKYPWYTVHSELKDLVPPRAPALPRGQIAIHTAGYEGRSVDGFFDTLLRAGVKRIVDVRFNPVSRKYGFAASSMRDIGSKLGITYEHLPQLGIDGRFRAALDDTSSYQRLFDRYERDMLPRQPGAIASAARLVAEVPTTLVCMERAVECCHRGRLATHLERKTGLPIMHL